MNFVVKSLIKFLSSPNATQTSFFTLNEKFICAQLIIRVFYAIIFFFSILNLPAWENYLSTTNINPLWPVFWLSYVNFYAGITAILWFQFLSSLLGITFPQWRIVRVSVFLSLLELVAFKNSFDKIFHQEHLILLLSFVLIFLPSGWHWGRNSSKSVQTGTLLVFSGCQALILLTYTMSGLGKVIYSIIQTAQGQISNLAPQALAIHIAQQLLVKNTTSYFGPWLIEHYYVGWPLMLGAIYLQFFALSAAFRPSLHQLWAFGLILFHLSVYLTTKINFELNCLWLTLFLINSPFRPVRFDWRQTLQDLPLIDLLFFKSRQKYRFKTSFNKTN